MFAQLLKHEFKSQAKLFLILSLAALGAGAVGGGMLTLFIHLIQSEMNTAGSAVGSIFSFMIMIFMLFAIVAYCVAMIILLLYRFYKHHFSDEGYLTFTLPATTHQILLSGILSFAIWLAITVVVAILAACMILTPVIKLIGGEIGVSFSALFTEGKSLYEQLGIQVGPLYSILQVLSSIAAVISGLILPLTAITIGSVVAKKHKILASFGIYYGIQLAVSMVTGVVNIIGLIGDYWASENANTISMYISSAVPMLLNLIIGIGGYFLMHHLVGKKLNLP